MPVINSREFKKKHGLPIDEDLSLADISRLSGFPRQALQEVYNRGIGAWKTNPENQADIDEKWEKMQPRFEALKADWRSRHPKT